MRRDDYYGICRAVHFGGGTVDGRLCRVHLQGAVYPGADAPPRRNCGGVVRGVSGTDALGRVAAGGGLRGHDRRGGSLDRLCAAGHHRGQYDPGGGGPG